MPTSTRSRTVKVNMGQVNITPLHAVCIATDAPTCRQAGISARPSRFRDLLGSQVISPRPFELTTPIVVGVLTTLDVFSLGYWNKAQPGWWQSSVPSLQSSAYREGRKSVSRP